MKYRFRLKHPLRLVIVFVAVVICMSLLYQNRNLVFWDRNVNRGGDNIVHQLQDNLAKNYKIYGKYLLVNDNNHTFALTKSGKVKWDIATPCANSIVKISGKYILVADVGGNSFWVIKNGKIIQESKMEDEIQTANINKNGYVTLSTNISAFSAHVLCLNPSGKTIYSWKVNEEYVLDAKMDNSNRHLAISMLDHENELISNTIYFVKIGSDKIINSTKYSGIVLSSLEYNSNGELLAIGDACTKSFTKAGNENWTVDYSVRALQTYAFQQGKNLTLFFKNSQNNSNVESYGLNNGKLLKSTPLDFAVKSASYTKGVVSANGDNNIALISANSRIKTQIMMNVNLTWQGLMKNKQQIFFVNNKNIEITRP